MLNEKQLIDQKQKLAKLIEEVRETMRHEPAAKVAQYLMSQGVKIEIKKPKRITDLTGKCGGCAFSVPAKPYPNSESYIRCKHEAFKLKPPRTRLKHRTQKACKKYVQKENGQEVVADGG